MGVDAVWGTGGPWIVVISCASGNEVISSYYTPMKGSPRVEDVLMEHLSPFPSAACVIEHFSSSVYSHLTCS